MTHIVRGEPNQVTKDAIEEARKMNGETLSDEKLAEIAGQVPHSDANNVREMTHDELLAELDSQIESSKAVGCDCKSCDNAKALRAVVGLHKPEGINAPPQCAHDRREYPCPTIQAIEKELL